MRLQRCSMLGFHHRIPPRDCTRTAAMTAAAAPTTCDRRCCCGAQALAWGFACTTGLVNLAYLGMSLYTFIALSEVSAPQLGGATSGALGLHVPGRAAAQQQLQLFRPWPLANCCAQSDLADGLQDNVVAPLRNSLLAACLMSFVVVAAFLLYSPLVLLWCGVAQRAAAPHVRLAPLPQMAHQACTRRRTQAAVWRGGPPGGVRRDAGHGHPHELVPHPVRSARAAPTVPLPHPHTPTAPRCPQSAVLHRTCTQVARLTLQNRQDYLEAFAEWGFGNWSKEQYQVSTPPWLALLIRDLSA